MKNLLFTVLIVTAASLFFSACFLPTSSTTVKGRVTEYGQKPVVNAEISFGGTGLETLTKTDADGNFTVTARHRPAQMLYLKVSKSGFADYENKFPGFGAPAEIVKIELMQTIPRTR